MQSDGGSSSYYQHIIPAGVLKVSGGPADGSPLVHDVVMETDDVIKIFLKNDWHKANIFKALVRIGSKDGIDESYDFKKMRWFLDRLELYANVHKPKSEVPEMSTLYDSFLGHDPIWDQIMQDIKTNN